MFKKNLIRKRRKDLFQMILENILERKIVEILFLIN